MPSSVDFKRVSGKSPIIYFIIEPSLWLQVANLVIFLPFDFKYEHFERASLILTSNLSYLVVVKNTP